MEQNTSLSTLNLDCKAIISRLRSAERHQQTMIDWMNSVLAEIAMAITAITVVANANILR